MSDASSSQGNQALDPISSKAQAFLSSGRSTNEMASDQSSAPDRWAQQRGAEQALREGGEMKDFDMPSDLGKGLQVTTDKEESGAPGNDAHIDS
ncbi:MAG: hypothetical protein CYPHOPRED_004389 [Cyphobasidiales sp. Tagirdzhanova-0007]|nr:MAG: hypothetical protein CYPHOPRED_004389 [Cyphobasidiales sp. Tagirdzhanova-0007]